MKADDIECATLGLYYDCKSPENDSVADVIVLVDSAQVRSVGG